MASFRIFPLSLIFCVLKVIKLNVRFVCFCACVFYPKHLSCLAFSELPGLVVWCVTLIWGKFLVIIVSHVFYTHITTLTFVPQFLEILFFFLSLFCLLTFWFWRFLLRHSEAWRVFLSPIQSNGNLATGCSSATVSKKSQLFLWSFL